ncbi:MAG: DUF4349 domain-containing protein [Gemmatimonadaceae bacterium]|nr:DUF4349 domain-containing protein [Gemmatimonadaceae bacterium]
MDILYGYLSKRMHLARPTAEPSNELNMNVTPVVAIVAAIALLACNDGRDATHSRELTGSAEQTASAPPVSMEMSKQVAVMNAAQSAAQPAEAHAPSDRATTAGTVSEIAQSMLIRTGNASIEVGELDPAIIKVRQLATQLGGYIANSSITGGRDQVRSATLELKIPAARYDQAVSELGGIGKVESANTNVEDVGEEYVDVTARVTNAKRLEERLVNLLATRTGKLEDVLAVERELARVREEIERYEGRLRFLRTRAAVSTLSVTVHEPVPILGQSPGQNPIAAALRQAWRNFVGLVAWFIASLGVLVPLGGIGVLGWYFYRRFRR